MTAVDLDALDKLREKATPGPWRRNCQPGVIFGGSTPMPIAAGYTPPDAALIVAAVNALPDLLAEARRYRALREAVEGLAENLLRPVDHEVTHYRDGLRDAGKHLRAAVAAVDPPARQESVR